MNITPDSLSRSAWLQLAHWRRRVRSDRVLRVALSYYVLNGIACAIGLLLVSVLMHTLFGATAAANATVGVIATLAADIVGPRRGKLKHMVVAPLLGVPLFLAVQLLRDHPVQLGLLLVPATFVAFLIMAWGKRGGPVAIGVMLAMIFALSTPPVISVHEALLRTAHCALRRWRRPVRGVFGADQPRTQQPIPYPVDGRSAAGHGSPVARARAPRSDECTAATG